MAKINRTTSTTGRATAANATKSGIRPEWEAMDKLNQAFEDLKETANALLYAVEHLDDDGKECRPALMRLLSGDLATLETAERQAWRVVVGDETQPGRSSRL